MENIEIILASITSSTVITGILAFLFRTWISERLKGAIKNEYDEKLETHKANLRAETEVELEKFKSSLQIEAHKQNTRYTKVFDEIALTVTTVYEKIVLFEEAVSNYVSLIEWAEGPSKEERRNITNEKMQDFLTYYKVKKIYLPKETIEKIDAFWQGLYEISIDFLHGVDQKSERGETIDLATWKKAHDFTTKEVPNLLKSLDEDLRDIIGTNN